MKILLLTGTEHGFDKVAQVLAEIIAPVCELRVTDSKDVLASLSTAKDRPDAVIFGTGFSRRQAPPSNWYDYEAALSPAQEEGILDFVQTGGGFIGVHLAGWYVGGEPLQMLGGHANWHPPAAAFTVDNLAPDHPIMRGVGAFTFHGEAYMAAWQPGIEILGTTRLLERDHPLLWTNRYGDGRVFYGAIGHEPETFRIPEAREIFLRAVRWVCRDL